MISHTNKEIQTIKKLEYQMTKAKIKYILKEVRKSNVIYIMVNVCSINMISYEWGEDIQFFLKNVFLKWKLCL